MDGEHSDDFVMVPKGELEALKQEVEQVKKNPVQNYESSLTLIESMDRLADQLSTLVTLFERTNKQMHEDYKKGFHEDGQKLDTLIHQNEKIAKGILALADKNHTHTKAPETPSYPLSQEEPTTSSESTSKSRRSMIREFS